LEYRISLKAGSDPVLRVSSSTFLHCHCYRTSLWFPEPQHPLNSYRPLKYSFIIGAGPSLSFVNEEQNDLQCWDQDECGSDASQVVTVRYSKIRVGSLDRGNLSLVSLGHLGESRVLRVD